MYCFLTVHKKNVNDLQHAVDMTGKNPSDKVDKTKSRTVVLLQQFGISVSFDSAQFVSLVLMIGHLCLRNGRSAA